MRIALGAASDAGSEIRFPVMVTSIVAEPSPAPTRTAGPSTCRIVLPVIAAPRRPSPIAQITMPLQVPQCAPDPVIPARPMVLSLIIPETRPLEGFAMLTEMGAVRLPER